MPEDPSYATVREKRREVFMHLIERKPPEEAPVAGAFTSADLILGGYENPIPLDETIDAVFASGRMIPVELRVTSLGGIAVAPSALALPNLRTRGGARSEG